MLRDQGKTHQEIAQITGYTRTYVSTMLKRLSATPQLLEGMSRGGRPQGSLRALTVKEERRVYERDDAAAQDWLTIEHPKIKARAKREKPRSVGVMRRGCVRMGAHRGAGGDRKDPRAPGESRAGSGAIALAK
jgi:hypothetical protein